MADIVHQVQIEAPPDSVYELVATPAGLAAWWAEDVVAGDETAELGFFNRSTVYRLRKAEMRPNELAAWRCETGQEWSGTTLEFVLQPAEAGSKLRFSHRDWRDQTDYFFNCNTTWGALMYRLKAAAEGKTPGPFFSRTGFAD